jgi:threonine synthase
MDRPIAAGWACAVCGARVDIATPLMWRCPNASDSDRHHALQLVQAISPLRGSSDDNPFVSFRPYLAWDGFAAAAGLTEAARTAMVRLLDAEIAAVAGGGFHVTPFERADALSDALGFGVDGGVWVKDETGQVAGSHKPRHLVTILLHLLTAESTGLATWAEVRDRPSLAIASCGNAAFAAATLAAAVGWPLRVFVPPSADPVVLGLLGELRAEIVECPRRGADPPGDPCIHRFRDAVAAGAIPFTVQGPENAWCLDGGRTIGWEMARHLEEHVPGPPLDRLFVQVGAGTFAASAINGFRMSGLTPRLHAVQTDSCAPLARAWDRVQQFGGPGAAAGHWSDCMWPWEEVGSSAADGILDDETYDWIPVLRGMEDSRGGPIVVTEAQVLQANELSRSTTGINASHTGTAGLAGLLAARESVSPAERVAVVFSGVRRSAP